MEREGRKCVKGWAHGPALLAPQLIFALGEVG